MGKKATGGSNMKPAHGNRPPLEFYVPEPKFRPGDPVDFVFRAKAIFGLGAGAHAPHFGLDHAPPVAGRDVHLAAVPLEQRSEVERIVQRGRHFAYRSRL